MVEKSKLKPIASAVGIALATTLAASPLASADQNPFSVSEMSNGYMVADAEGKCGEGKCGDDKAKAEDEGKCGEGKCGEGKCGADEGDEGDEDAEAAE